jgi:hypothetical protein
MRRVGDGSLISWTVSREQLLALLHDMHPDLAEMYSQAIESLGATPLTRPKLILGSHCIRELIPSLLEVQRIDRPSRSNDSRAVKELSEAWATYGLGLEPDTGEADSTDDTLRPVPHAIYLAARAAASAGAEGTQNARTVTALLALGQDTEINTAPLRRLHTAIQKFASWSHRRDYTKPLKDVPEAELIESQLRIFEEALLTRFANRGDRVSTLREALRQANRRDRKVSDV